eukprot:9494153-Pyramimonas_sp.AAC.1
MFGRSGVILNGVWFTFRFSASFVGGARYPFGRGLVYLVVLWLTCGWGLLYFWAAWLGGLSGAACFAREPGVLFGGIRSPLGALVYVRPVSALLLDGLLCTCGLCGSLWCGVWASFGRRRVYFWVIWFTFERIVLYFWVACLALLGVLVYF